MLGKIRINVLGAGEKKLCRNKSSQIPYFMSIPRESKIHLLCPLTTVQNARL